MSELNTETERQNVFLVQYSNQKLSQNITNTELILSNNCDKESQKRIGQIKNQNITNIDALAGKRTSSELPSVNDDINILIKTQAEIDGKIPGRWSEKEHNLYLEGIKLYGKNWRMIEQHIGTRNSTQIRSHDQKYMIKANKRSMNRIQSPSEDLQQPKSQINSEVFKENNKETPRNSPGEEPEIMQKSKIESLPEGKSLRYFPSYSSMNEYSCETECPMISLNRLFRYFSSLPNHEGNRYLNDLKILGNCFKYLFTIKLNLTRKMLEKIEFDHMKMNYDFPSYQAKPLDSGSHSHSLETQYSNSICYNSSKGYKDCSENDSFNNSSRYCFKLVNEKYRNRLAALDKIKRKCFDIIYQENHK